MLPPLKNHIASAALLERLPCEPSMFSTQAAVKEFAASTATCIYAGKRGQKPSTKQSDIDAMLVDFCLQV